MTKIQKSEGTTPTEKLLVNLCEQTFLKLWSYPNPFKDDGKELCDLLVVFEDQIIIFFDRHKTFEFVADKDPSITWERWKRGSVGAQIKTATGAERYLKSSRKIFLDSKKAKPFPLPIDPVKSVCHKIIVAHGVAEACKEFSDENISGSLAISYSKESHSASFPFFIDLEKNNPVHVLDSHTLPLILSELDTITDFTRYLNAKLDAIHKYDPLSYCGEEDLLAHYFLNFDESNSKHYIGSIKESFNSVMIGEGEWSDFVQLDIYKQTKEANKISYLWDEVIQRTSENALDGKTLGRSPLEGKGAIQEMAKEPRFVRRALCDHIFRSIENFPANVSDIYRSMSFMPSIDPKKAYIFMQLKTPDRVRNEENYREKRQTILIGACGAAKNNFPKLEIIVGILIEPPKLSDDLAEDFAVLYCETWSNEDRKHYEEIANELGFFKTAKPHFKTIQEFVSEKRKN